MGPVISANKSAYKEHERLVNTYKDIKDISK